MIKDCLRQLVGYFSRKFVLSATSLASGFWLVLHNKGVAEYSLLVATVLGFYNGANVVETVAAMRKNKPEVKPADTKVEVNVEG